jgi:hypothetical protein
VSNGQEGLDIGRLRDANEIPLGYVGPYGTLAPGCEIATRIAFPRVGVRG